MLLLATAALAAETTVVLDGVVPDDGLDHFRVPFEVPAGTVEIEVRHDDLSELDILDWGLDGPGGEWRGWGGGTSLPAVVNAGAASPGYVPGPITPGTWSVVCGEALIARPPGAYHVEVVLRDTITLPAQDRGPWTDRGALPGSRGPGWYAGDVHVHSAESTDADASLDAIADLAREQGLDWVVVTDHNTVTGHDYIAAAQDRHPDLLLVPGTEYTTYDGHAGAYGSTAWVDHKIGQPGVTIEAAAAAYAAQGAVLAINHPVLDLGDLCIGCAWEHEIPDGGFAAIEIATGGWLPAGNLFTPDAIELWDSLSDQGIRLAPVGGSDDHRAGQDGGPLASPIGSPTTMVFADELSVEAVLAGIRAGRTVVKLQDASDPMAELAPDRVVVTGGVGAELVWVADGEEVQRLDVSADPQTFPWEGDAGRIRAEVWIDGDPRTVTADLAPSVGIGGPAPPDEQREGCGCDGSHPLRIGVSPALALIGLGRVRRRRVASRS